MCEENVHTYPIPTIKQVQVTGFFEFVLPIYVSCNLLIFYHILYYTIKLMQGHSPVGPLQSSDVTHIISIIFITTHLLFFLIIIISDSVLYEDV